ncbi:dTDP-4-dehydrorhamnose reductase [Luteimonas sp. RIT-PG2_3]
MKALLLGANGQVGRELQRSLAGTELVRATRHGVLEDGARCEVADFDLPASLASLVDRIAPDVVVNAAAYTAVDRAETEPDAAYRANAESPQALAEACARRDALLVHYSTDYVFNGGGNRPYREDDATDPLGVYGASKRAGELAIQASGARHLIFRTAWVYASHGRNFLLTMLRLAADRDELRVVADQFGTPTPAALIADATRDVLASARLPSGIWHLTASGQTSWHGFASAIMESAHARGLLPRQPRVIPITTEAFPTPARRPAYSCLDVSRLADVGGVVLPDWRDQLERILDELSPARAA